MAKGLDPARLQDSPAGSANCAMMRLCLRLSKRSLPHGKGHKKSGTELFLRRRPAALNRGTFAKLANFSERTPATDEKPEELPAAIRLVMALLEIFRRLRRTAAMDPDPKRGT
jgi:hypothetical protein